MIKVTCGTHSKGKQHSAELETRSAAWACNRHRVRDLPSQGRQTCSAVPWLPGKRKEAETHP